MISKTKTCSNTLPTSENPRISLCIPQYYQKKSDTNLTLVFSMWCKYLGSRSVPAYSYIGSTYTGIKYLTSLVSHGKGFATLMAALM